MTVRILDPTKMTKYGMIRIGNPGLGIAGLTLSYMGNFKTLISKCTERV